MAQDFRAAGRLSATDVDSPLIRVLGSLGSRFLGLLDPISVPENQNKPQHRQKALPAPPACLARTLHIFFAHSPSLYKTEPQPRPLGEAVTYRSRRQTELQQRALRHRAPLVAHAACPHADPSLPRPQRDRGCLASTAIAIVVAWCECQLRRGLGSSALLSPTQFLVSTPPMAVSV